MIFIIDDDVELPTSIANGGGVATNRNAVGPLVASLPEAAMLGDCYEVHSVESVDLTVKFPPTHVFCLGEQSGQSITLTGGGCIVATRTKPAVWTGLISGSYTIE